MNGKAVFPTSVRHAAVNIMTNIWSLTCTVRHIIIQMSVNLSEKLKDCGGHSGEEMSSGN